MIGKRFPYTTPSGHTYKAPTDYESLSHRMMDYLQSVIECWDEDESPPNPLAFPELAKFAWSESVLVREERDRLRESLREIAWPRRAAASVDPRSYGIAMRALDRENALPPLWHDGRLPN